MKRSELDEQLTDLLRSKRPEVPADVHEGIENLLNSLPYRRRLPHRRFNRSWAVGTAVLLLLAGTMLLVNGKSSFAETVKQKLYSIFFESGDPALVEKGTTSEMPVLLEKTDGNYTLRIHEVLFDGQRLSFSYSVSRPGGISQSLWVRPAFQLSAALKKAWPGIVGTDSGALRGDQKTGIVNYYFLGKAPDKLTLTVNVAGMAVFDDPAKQNVLPGDWSFQLPVEKKGAASRDLAKLPGVSDKDVYFEVKQLRLASSSTLWKLYWEYPSKLLPNALIEGSPSYDVRYRLQAAGKEMTVSLDYKDGGGLRKNGQLVKGINYATATLVTEQLPPGTKEVAITPILRTWSKDASGEYGYVESPLDSFALKVTVP